MVLALVRPQLALSDPNTQSAAEAVNVELEVVIAGTATRAPLFQDAAGAVPLAQPIRTGARGFTQEFYVEVDTLTTLLAWRSGGLQGGFLTLEGQAGALAQAALDRAAVVAAGSVTDARGETGALVLTTAAGVDLPPIALPEGKEGKPGIPGPGAVPADAAVKAYMADPGTQSGQELRRTIGALTDPSIDAALGVPSALAGVALFGVGNSWVQSDANGRYIEKVGAATGVASYANLGLNGARMQDTAANLVKEGTRKWASRLGGVTVVNDLLNNLIEADTPQNRAAALECLRAAVALFSSSSRIETDTATDLSGFTSSTQAHASGGTLMQATAEGSRFDLAVPAAGDYYLLGHGANGLGWNTGSGTNWIGGIITVTQGAKTWTKDFDAIAQNTWLVVSNGFNPAVMKLPGLEAGTIRVTHSKGARANAVSQIDVLLPMSTRPPLVVIVKPVTVTAATHNKPALFDHLRTIPDTVAAEFANVFVVDPQPGWDASTMLQADGLHPNTTGAEHLTRFVSRAIAGELNRRARRATVAALV